MHWLLDDGPSSPPAPTHFCLASYGLDFVVLEWEFIATPGDPVKDAELEVKQSSSIFWSPLFRQTDTDRSDLIAKPVLTRCSQIDVAGDHSSSLENSDVQSSVWRATIAGLQPNTQYDFRVYGVGVAGRSREYTLVHASTVIAPPAPQKLSCVERRATSLQLEWQVVSKDDGPVRSCEIQYHATGAIISRWQPKLVVPDHALGSESEELTTWGCSLEGLSPGTWYAVRVRSNNDAGPSTEFSETCEFATIASPGPPKLLEEAGRKSHCFTVRIHVDDPEQAPVLACEVEVRRADAKESPELSLATRRAHVDSAAWNATIIGLAPATSFTIRARARNCVGWGQYSHEAIAITTDQELDMLQQIPPSTGESAILESGALEPCTKAEDALVEPKCFPDDSDAESTAESTRSSRNEQEAEQQSLAKSNFDQEEHQEIDVETARVFLGRPLLQNDRPLRILCLDGGGVKGLNTVWMLERLEAYLGCPIPWEKYDLICGSSIGGIITSDIASGLRSTSEEFEQLMWAVYRRIICPCKTLDRVVRGYGICRDQLKAFAELTCPEGRAYAMPFNSGIPCFVTTARCCADGKPELFLVRNYSPSMGRDAASAKRLGMTAGCFGSWSLRDAKAATAAAPTYIQSHWREDDPSDDSFYIDGGLYACNPTTVAILEAKQMWPGRRIGAVHSFGVGSVCSKGKEGGALHDRNVVDWIQNICEIAMDCDNAALQAGSMLSAFEPGASYVRLQTPPSDVNPFENDINRLAELKVATRDFLESGKLNDAFAKIAEDLQLCEKKLQPTASWRSGSSQTRSRRSRKNVKHDEASESSIVEAA